MPRERTLSPLAGERRRGGKETASTLWNEDVAHFTFPPSLTLPRKGGREAQ
jgi:hypothetical protein